MKKMWMIFGACGVCLAILIFAILSGSAILGGLFASSSHASSVGVGLNQTAPNIPVRLTNGTNVTLNSFHGRPVVLWFIATWCSSCQYGAQLLASQYYSKIHSKGAVILVVELYNDLGVVGPPLQVFATQYGGGLNKTGWLYGTSTQNATYEYDPNTYLDIYYVINSNGVIINEGTELPANLDNIVSSL